MSDSSIVYGGVVEKSIDGTAATYERIPEAKGLPVPSTTMEYIDVTNLDSPNGFREYIKGLKDAGELTLECNYTPEGYAQQISDQAEAGAIYYRVTLPPMGADGTQDVFVFRAFPTPQLAADDVGAIVGMTVNLRTTGDVQYNPVAA